MPKSITQKTAKSTSGLASIGAATQPVQQAPVAAIVQGAQTAQAPMPAVQGAEMAQAPQPTTPMSGMAQATPPAPTWIGSSPAAKPSGSQPVQKTTKVKSSIAPKAEEAPKQATSSQIELPNNLKSALAQMGTFTKVRQGFYKAVNDGVKPEDALHYTLVNYGPEVQEKMKMDYEITQNLSSMPKTVSADEFLSLIDEYGPAYVRMAGIMPKSIMGMPDGQGVLSGIEDSDFVKIQDAMGNDWMEEYQYKKSQEFHKKAIETGVAVVTGMTDTVSTIGKAAMGNPEAQSKVLAVTGNLASGAFGEITNLSKTLNPFTYVEKYLKPDSNSPTFIKSLYKISDFLAPHEYTDAAAEKFSKFIDDELGDVPWADTVGALAVDLYSALGAGKLANYVYGGTVGKAGSVLKGTQMYLDAFKAAPSLVDKLGKATGIGTQFAAQSMAETAGFIAAARGELPNVEDYGWGMFYDGIFRGGGAILKDYLSPFIYNTAVVPKVPKGAGYQKVEELTQFGMDKFWGGKKSFVDTIDKFIDIQYKDVQDILTKIDSGGKFSYDLESLVTDKDLWKQYDDVALMDKTKAGAVLNRIESFIQEYKVQNGTTIVNASELLKVKQAAADFIGKNWDQGVAAEPTIAGAYQGNFIIWKHADDLLDELHPAIKPLNGSISSAISLKSPVATFLEKKGSGVDLSVFSGFQRFPSAFPVLTTLAKVLNSGGKALKYAGKLDTGKLFMEETTQPDGQYIYQK